MFAKTQGETIHFFKAIDVGKPENLSKSCTHYYFHIQPEPTKPPSPAKPTTPRTPNNPKGDQSPQLMTFSKLL